MQSIDWYNKYTGFPFKHLGNSIKTGIDCFNLSRHVIQEELKVNIPLKTSDFCNIVDDDWYNKTTESLFDIGATTDTEDYGWTKVVTPKPFDIILMSIGGTNITNHCALYIGDSKMLQTMTDHVSWVAPYGRYYKQYTIGIYRWKFLNS